VIAWLSVLKGFLLTCCPDFSLSIYKKCATSGLFTFTGFIAFVLGLVLLYKGFM
jgi:hypothetical protein